MPDDEVPDDEVPDDEVPDDEVPGGDVVARIERNLETLRALEVVQVGELIVDADVSTMNCYAPCTAEIAALRAQQAAALETLAGLARDLATPGEPIESCDLGAAEGDLATLRSLAIVGIGEFLAADAANNPMCYNLPCEEDVRAATAVSCERAARLGELAARAADVFEVTLIETATPRDVVAEVDDNMRRLGALGLFPVGELMVGVSTQQGSCYLCPLEFQDEPTAALRLAHLAAVAEQAIGDYELEPSSAFAGCDPEDGEAAIASLRALQIVEIGALYDWDAAQAGLCYASLCTDVDEAVADALTCRRAAAAQALADVGRGL